MLTLLHHLVAVSLVAPAEGRTAPEPTVDAGPARSASTPLRAMRIDAPGDELQRFPEELSLRVPHIPVMTEREGPEPRAWIRIRRLPTDRPAYEVTIVVSDGRGYFRRLEADGDDPARLVAANVANLLLAIEDGTAAPDRDDAVMPEEPGPADEGEPTPPPVGEEPPPSVGVPAPGLTVALVVSGDAILGLGPPTDTSVFAGAGGSVGALARGPRGAAVMADLRLAGRGAGDRGGLLRTRVALGGGYVYVRRRLELDALAMGTVEPWTVTGGQSVRPRPRALLGLGARLAVGYRIPLGSTVVRLAPRVELALSGVPADGLRVARVTDGETGAPLLRTGGLELAVGVDVAFWFGLRRAAQAGSTSNKGSPSSTSEPSSGNVRTIRAGSGNPSPP